VNKIELDHNNSNFNFKYRTFEMVKADYFDELSIAGLGD